MNLSTANIYSRLSVFDILNESDASGHSAQLQIQYTFENVWSRTRTWNCAEASKQAFGESNTAYLVNFFLEKFHFLFYSDLQNIKKTKNKNSIYFSVNIQYPLIVFIMIIVVIEEVILSGEQIALNQWIMMSIENWWALFSYISSNISPLLVKHSPTCILQ